MASCILIYGYSLNNLVKVKGGEAHDDNDKDNAADYAVTMHERQAQVVDDNDDAALSVVIHV